MRRRLALVMAGLLIAIIPATETIGALGGGCSDKPWIDELVCRANLVVDDGWAAVWTIYCDLVCANAAWGA